MLTRRALLTAVGAASLGSGLAGCTAPPPIVVTLPWLPPAPLTVTGAPEALAAWTGIAQLSRSLVSNAQRWKLSAAQLGTATWLAQAAELHRGVLGSGDPARRQMAVPANDTVITPGSATREACYNALTQSLARVGRDHRRRALATSGLPALLWASLAAFGSTMAARVQGRINPGTDGPGREPSLLTPAEMHTALTERSQELIFGLTLAAAAPGLGALDRDLLISRVNRWTALRDTLTELQRAVSLTPPTAAVAYDVPRPATANQGRALAARLELAMQPQLGGWVANATDEDRPRAVDALVDCSATAARLGAPVLRWPGWPA